MSDIAQIPELGVGLVYVPDLHYFIASNLALFDVVEIEPQTLWRNPPTGTSKCLPNIKLLDLPASLPKPKIVHGVGSPVGGSVTANPGWLEGFAESANCLGALWASEHLAFNRVRQNSRERFTGFMLPPLQSASSVAVAVERIRATASAVSLPFAIETGVNYLRPRHGEMPDGEFFAEVTTRADCGILLDLHNLYANEHNGRQKVREFLSQIPLDRVWEVHVAGGCLHGDYWLDAHSGLVPVAVKELLHDFLPDLFNVKALIFEILAPFVKSIGLERLTQQMVELRNIWHEARVRCQEEKHRRRQSLIDAATVKFPSRASCTDDSLLTVSRSNMEDVMAWENELATLVAANADPISGGFTVAQDPAIALYRELAANARIGALTAGLPLTFNLLLLTYGKDALDDLLQEYLSEVPPCIYAPEDSLAFVHYLEDRAIKLEYLEDIVAYEVAVIRCRRYDSVEHVQLSHDPDSVIAALSAGHLPTAPKASPLLQLEIRP